MNADAQGLTHFDRFNLVASEAQIASILSQSKFPPLKIKILLPEDPSVPVNEFQKEFIEESSCMVCKEIPVKPKECSNCNKIICFFCELKLSFKNGVPVSQKSCHNCKVIENTETSFGDDSQASTGKKKGPGDLINRPLYQAIQNKLLNQMLGQIKVLHRCNSNQQQLCVLLEELEKHIENKCQGFEIECFACGKKVKTLKGIQRHIKYECPKLKINCYFCGHWISREQFKSEQHHPCQTELDQIFSMFKKDQSDPPLDISLATESVNASLDFRESESRAARRSRPIFDPLSLRHRNELPLIMNLFQFQKGKSFMDKRHCLSEHCPQKFGSGHYPGQIKLELTKEDNDVAEKCFKCLIMRYCAMYTCRVCDYKVCFYCLIEASKKQLLANISNYTVSSSRISQVPPDAPSSGASNNSSSRADAEIKNEESQHLEQIQSNFGKYTNQFLKFSAWPVPEAFFSRQSSWQRTHGILEPFSYLEFASKQPKIHQPDRLEKEIVQIQKANIFVYEGQVLVNSRNFHGFGRLLHNIAGFENGDAWIYEGWFINGLPQGWGRKTYQDGTVFTGQFRCGLEHGEGSRTRLVVKENESEREQVSEKGTFFYGMMQEA